VLVPNLRKEDFQYIDFRQKLFSDHIFSEEINLSLFALDCEVQRKEIEEIESKFLEKNVVLNIEYFSPIKYQEVLDEQDFELLLYGYDFTQDRDPYVFWHSSQIDNLNFAGYENKESDILLEDARMILDRGERNIKYDEFFQILQDNNLAIFYEPLEFDFAVNDQIVKGIEKASGDGVTSRYFNINEWYIKEKRVRK